MDNKDLIIESFDELARESGLINITLETLCARAQVSPGSFKYIMGVSFTEYKEAQRSRFKDQDHKLSRRRVSKEERYNHIVNKAYEIAEKYGLINLKRSLLSDISGVSPALISHYFSSMDGVFIAVVKKAIIEDDLTILRESIALETPGHQLISENLADDDMRKILEKRSRYIEEVE
jgi:hypothetical protein